MDKSAIKNFAVSARVKLKEQIEQKAYTFGITKNGIEEVDVFEDTFEVNGNKYNKELLKHRESLVKKINGKGFEQVVEEVAYTWFNRLIAIRFMEVNEYLPSGVRVLSSTDSNKVEPDIIREASNLDFENLNIDLIYKLQDENNTEELYKYLLIKECNELGRIMPLVFEEIEDFTELLLPNKLLQEGSIIRDLVTSITEEDWKEQVEIIGWLYQYYISEKKDEVFDALKKNVKITKENIPAATQLFTPDWIVKYMVENSLGRLWLESHPDEELKAKWKYYLDEAEQEPEVMKQLQVIRDKDKDLRPEDIKVIDCCMGSGHILVYQFDVLYDIYKSAGYSEREIPKLILEKNLYGLDIDDRAAQLAYFAVMMKARSYNRRIFREKVDLNICSIQESNGFPKEAIDYLVNSKETEIERRVHRDDVEYLINVFNDAKEYGSILEVKEINFDAIEKRIEEIRNGDTIDIFEWQYKNIILEKIPSLIKQSKIMNKKYDVVCTNPPYLGRKGMNDKLMNYVDTFYGNTKADLFAVFIDKGFRMLQKNGFNSMVTMHSWLFLDSFEDLRKNIIDNYAVYSILHLGYEAFESIIGKVVQTAAFIIRKNSISSIIPTNIRLVDFYDARRHEKKTQFFNSQNRYEHLRQVDFLKIPGYTYAYWISKNLLKSFYEGKRLENYAVGITKGIFTGDNNRFIRYWYEVSKSDFDCRKWNKYSKGGPYRKWYGNSLYVVKWHNNAQELRNFKGSGMGASKYYDLPHIVWSKVTTLDITFRMDTVETYFDDASPAILFREKVPYDLFGFLNSKVCREIVKLIAPTLNYQIGDIKKIPILQLENDEKQIVENAVIECINIAKEDWNAFEQSWDFSRPPLLRYSNQNSVERAFNAWENYVMNQFYKLKENEELINDIFIEAYGSNEIKRDISEDEVTIRKAEKHRDIKSFISYAVGCILGRYSLDEGGLIYAGGQFNPDSYKTFKADVDNVIPITDDEYFEDDIVSRFVEFVKITFAEETLEENLDYIADTLGKKGNETSRQTIRRYFLKDFYKDHLQTYQKRPIYWLFDSGKNDGFKALIYMHRYDTGTVARVRTDYLHLLQRKYEAEVNRLDMVMENSNASAREKTEARKKKEKIQKQILECIQYDQVIAHVANQKISIDLDDGVVVNYGKFQGIEVPQGDGRKPLKADLLSKI